MIFDEKFIRRTTAFIEENISNPGLNAEILGHELGVSRRHIYRKIKELTHQTVHEFIRNIRLKKAEQLLETNLMTITEIAYKVGFSELSYFTHCFHKKFNQSPSKYKAYIRSEYGLTIIN